MNYQESIEYIESLNKFGNHSLANIELFLAYTGKPQNNFKSIHVGGTNGKGSSSKIVASLATTFQLKTGLYTGPHIYDWVERYEIDAVCISKDKFSQIATCLKKLNKDLLSKNAEFKGLSWFEFLTCIAFFWFSENNVDLAVIEVGMGGRLDATNVISQVLATIITNTELDHTHILGNTVNAIASQKACIIKKQTPIITACNNEGLSIIEDFAKSNQASLIKIDPVNLNVDFLGQGDDLKSVCHEFKLLIIKNLNLLGSFQEVNCLCALIAFYLAIGQLNRGLLSDWSAFKAKIAVCLKKITWPGRLQYHRQLGLVVDACHNPSGAAAIKKSLDELFVNSKRIYVFACYQNKSAYTILKNILNPQDYLITTEFVDSRPVYSADELFKIARLFHPKTLCSDSINKAIDLAFEMKQADDIIVAIGSFKIVKAVNEYANITFDDIVKV